MALAALALALAAPAPAVADEWRPGGPSAKAYAQKRAGSVSFAVRTPGTLLGYRSRTGVPSASVVKAMLMVSYLNHRRVRRRALTRADLALLSPMIRRSDNRAATHVRDFVGNAALRALARRVGMRAFRTAPSWGGSRITAADQSKLFLKIDRYVVGRHRRTAMRLLNTVVRSQRWGVARARPRAWAIYFKGGWGSGSGAVDHQVALLRRGRRRVSVAILTTGNPSMSYGNETLRGVARRLLRGLGPDSRLPE